MKTKFATLFVLFIVYTASGQLISKSYWEGTLGSFSSIHRFGNVSIGTTQNDGELTVYKNDIPRIVLKNSFGSLEIARAGWNGAFHPTAIPGTTVFRTLGQSQNMIFNMPNNNNDGGHNIRITDELHHHILVAFDNGKVTMGTENYDNENYNLYVKNGIKTEKIKVEIASVGGWADYVFDKDYNLIPLKDLEKFLLKNNRLPEIPSAEEVVKNGVELKSMNVLLLKKIEELTLYTIEQQKLIEKIHQEIEVLKEQINH